MRGERHLQQISVQKFYSYYFGHSSGRTGFGRVVGVAWHQIVLACSERNKSSLDESCAHHEAARKLIVNARDLLDGYCSGAFMEGLEWRARNALIAPQGYGEQLLVQLRYLYDKERRWLIVMRLGARHAAGELSVFETLRRGFVVPDPGEPVDGIRVWVLDSLDQIDHKAADVDLVHHDTIRRVAISILTGVPIEPYPLDAVARQARLPLSY
jgi:hypothetical protein